MDDQIKTRRKARKNAPEVAGNAEPNTGTQSVSENAQPSTGTQPVSEIAPGNGSIADKDEVLRYLTSVMRGESRVSTAREPARSPDEKERLRAAELLGKGYGLYTDRSAVRGAPGVVIEGEEQLED